ncbi:RNA 2',3'-cyclic phosphodiesterase [Neobacillus sp. FSL H8-0543]|uniref:RNA 2',3'-cyclic phosphodiesterase n=1 Tax=Neobacillus sp. FSL H8-0543 TaxID=2954672 RepID=UPI00315972C8
MEQQAHYFFAVKLPEETKVILKSHIEKLKGTLPFSRWVHYEDLHITLAFLGYAPVEKLRLANENVHESLRHSNILELKINQLGIFGNQDSPRIFWADTLESPELQNVRKKVFHACFEAGFQLETRPFRPHITLARKWEGEGSFHNHMLDIWQEIQPGPLTFKASEVVLYQTHLQKTPKYEVKTAFQLLPS